MKVDDFLARLQKVRKQRGYWTACCPAHPDRNPSMSIRDMGDGIAVKCFAGCETADIARAVNLEPTDLRPEKDSKAKILDTYPYHGPDGELLFEVVRYVPKAFKQRKPKADGGWEWNLSGVTRVPYRLPELRDGIDEGRWVFLVEGEKDVHRLEDEGLCATTTPQGASNWSDDYAQWFAGGLVAIIPDNDPGGEEYAAKAADAISRVAREVRVAKLPDLKPKGDVNDWLYSHTVDELREVIRTTTAWDHGETVPLIDLGDESVHMEWPESAIEAQLNRLHWNNGLVHGEISIYWNTKPLIEYQRVNTQSASARRELVTELNRYDRDIEWHTILSRIFGEGIRHQRTSGQFIDMRSRPKAEPPKFLVGDMWPDMSRFSLLFGDGEAAKSTLSLALDLSIASGHTLIAGAEPHRVGPTAFIDFEDDEDLFDFRLQRMAVSYGINLADCHPIYYMRARNYIYENTESLARQLREREVIAGVIDSRSGAQSGSLSDDDSTRLLADAVMSLGIRAWIIDHLDKQSTKAKKAPTHSFGSVFLRNRAVSSWYAKLVSKSQGVTTITLTDRKWNHGPTRPTRTLAVDWTEGVRIDRKGEVVQPTEDRSNREMFVEYLADEGTSSTGELADWAGCSRDTARRTLNRDKDTFAKVGDYDLWTLTPEAREAAVEVF